MNASKYFVVITCIVLNVTGALNETKQNCTLSLTTVQGQAVCQEETVFTENFQTLNRSVWQHVIKIPQEPDYEFCIYVPDKSCSYVNNSELYLKPDAPNLRVTRLNLTECTGQPNTHECVMKEFGPTFIPSVKSAKLTTINSFSFKYGIVTIEAKLPVGDWILPELWLLPKLNGQRNVNYRFGRIALGMARGNKELICEGKIMGNRFLEGGITVGKDLTVEKKYYGSTRNSSWAEDYHAFTLIWSPDNMSFLVDGELMMSVLENAESTVSSELNLQHNGTISKLSPFDQEFYIQIGVSVGGMRDFPDECTSNGTQKFWANTDPKAIYNFWLHRKQFREQWAREQTALKIKRVTVSAL